MPSIPSSDNGGSIHGKQTDDRHALSLKTYLMKDLSLSLSLSLSPVPNQQLIGYDFSSTEKQKASFFYVLQQFGKLSNNGNKDFDFETWKKTRFILPFCLSGENPRQDLATRKIDLKPINTLNPYNLYLRFETPTER